MTLSRRGLLGGGLATTAFALCARRASAQNLHGDEALSKVLVEGEGWQLVGGGFAFTDAAAVDAAGNFYFSDVPRGTIHRVTPDGKMSAWWTGGPKVSGMAFARDGRLIAAVQGPRRQVIAVAPDTKAITILADNAAANDLVVTRGGQVYFTETTTGQVLAIAPGRKLRLAARGLAKPNGIALTPDEGTLAVSEFGGRHVWYYRLQPNGDLVFGAPYAELRTPVGRWESGGDGMVFDADGRLYVASFEGVQMFDWTGRMGGVLAKVPGGRTIVSGAFAGAEREIYYACAGDKVWRRPMKVRGSGPVAAGGTGQPTLPLSPPR